MSDLVGHILNRRYRIDSLIGRGGMADVYRAYDTRRGYPVAIKVLREDLAEDWAFVRRFQAEAEHLSRLAHQNIVRFYSFEQDGRVAFIVMDYVEGDTLRGRIFDAHGPLPPALILQVLRQLASALHYAHAEGIWHRDVKPANVMLTPRGDVLLSDFGIAKASDIVTSTTMTLGTPAYMSPEQCAGLAVDARTDVYSLGVVLYEMLTGERPFSGSLAPGTITGGTGERILWEQMYAAPLSPRQLNPSVPEAAAQVVLRALAKDPNERYQSAQAFAQAFEQAQAGGAARAAPQGAPATPRPAPAAPRPAPATPRPAPATPRREPATPRPAPARPRPAPVAAAAPEKKGKGLAGGTVAVPSRAGGGRPPSRAAAPPVTPTPAPPRGTPRPTASRIAPRRLVVATLVTVVVLIVAAGLLLAGGDNQPRETNRATATRGVSITAALLPADELSTPVAVDTATPTATDTSTAAPSSTPSRTTTATATGTGTPTPTPLASATASRTPTAAPTRTATRTSTPKLSATPQPSPSHTAPPPTNTPAPPPPTQPPPTEPPPTQAPAPTEPPPTEPPPTQVPPTSVPPTSVPPTEAPPTRTPRPP